MSKDLKSNRKVKTARKRLEAAIDFELEEFARGKHADRHTRGLLDDNAISGILLRAVLRVARLSDRYYLDLQFHGEFCDCDRPACTLRWLRVGRPEKDGKIPLHDERWRFLIEKFLRRHSIAPMHMSRGISYDRLMTMALAHFGAPFADWLGTMIGGGFGVPLTLRANSWDEFFEKLEQWQSADDPKPVRVTKEKR